MQAFTSGIINQGDKNKLIPDKRIFDIMFYTLNLVFIKLKLTSFMELTGKISFFGYLGAFKRALNHYNAGIVVNR